MKIVWKGSFYDASGYGNMSRLFVNHLAKYCDVSIINKSFKPSVDIFELKNLIGKYNTKELYEIAISGITPDLYKTILNSKLNYIYTMFETDNIPYKWLPFFPKPQNFIVPSEFVKNVFINKAKVIPEKINVIPIGYDKELICPLKKEDVRKELGIPNDKKVFLTVCDYNPRKGVYELFKAINRFKDNKDIVFLLKFAPIQNTKDYIINEIRLRLKNKNVKLVIDFIPDEVLNTLYRAADYLLSPTRGEGYGLPIIEAMSHGVVPIVTNWGSHLEFVKDSGFLIDYKLEEIKYGDLNSDIIELYVGHKWAVCNIDSIEHNIYQALNCNQIEKSKQVIEYAEKHEINHNIELLLNVCKRDLAIL